MDCSYYEILMVTRDASPEVIRAAYKALSQRWHPDKNDHKDAHEITALLNRAYCELSDPQRREAYDAWLATGCPEDPIPEPPKPRTFEVDEEKLRKGLSDLEARQKRNPPLGRTALMAAIIGALIS